MAGYTDVALFRRLLGQALPYWPYVSALFLLSLLSSPLSLLTPLPLRIAVDSVIGSHPLPPVIAPFVPEAIAPSPGRLLVLAVSLLLAVALLGQLQALASMLLGAWVSEKLVLGFRARLFRHVQRVSLAYHDRRGTADSTYRIQHDTLAVQHILIEGVIPLIAATVTLVGMIYVMARIDWQLALIALAISPILVVFGRAFRRRLRRQSRDVKTLESSALSIVQEVLGALRIVKAFGQEAREERRFLRGSGDGARAHMRLAGLEGSYHLLVGLTTAAGTAAVLLIGIGHVRSGVLTLGELLMVMGYLAQQFTEHLMTGRVHEQAVARGVSMAGVVKASTLYWGRNAPLVTLLKRRGDREIGHAVWGARISTDPVFARLYPGEIFVAHLAPTAPHAFRVDVAHGPSPPAEVLGRLAGLARDPAFVGYPYPLARAHQAARVTGYQVVDVRRSFRESLSRHGMSEDDIEVLFQDFHEVLNRS